ncbi:hypothetical protein [Cytobacillus purgationiresistens]|uniref:Rho termination factor N-terminal domain-containing protein n=1 Tax=Cytobacillus purgationiresistens TaxID=863449 RepID=A0ABU0AGE4_9BACI|nr:hypothetical protein [Cytobacillus purgationiresistens]MDQ0269944.1 hypothetical protein [Cytobacillus purgationiresistens]
MIVEVIDVPVRYNGKTYRTGEIFEMEEPHVDENIVKVISKVEKEPKTLDSMTVTELKEYSAENNINLGEAKKKEEILAVIKLEENAENPPQE